MRMAIPALVTHPSALFRDGVRQILVGTRFRPVHVAAALDEASIKHLSSAETCFWLLGLDKCSASTYEDVRRVCVTMPGVKAVLLAQSQTAEDVWPALEAGVSGFLLQDISCERLIKSLELIALGEIVVPFQFLQAVGARIAKPMNMQPSSREEPPQLAPALHVASGEVATGEDCFAPPQSSGLSRRETSILGQLMQGASNKVIARQLQITEATVKVHIKAILRKLRLHNRTQAAMWAYNNLGGVDVNYNGAEAMFLSPTPRSRKVPPTN